MNDEFESKGGEQSVAQGNNSIGKQINNYGIPIEEFSEYFSKLTAAEQEVKKLNKEILAQKSKNIYLHVKYIQSIRLENKILKFAIFTVVLSVAYVLLTQIHITQNKLQNIIFFIFIFFVGIILLKELLIEYRRREGLFGTNRTEAQELINFIIKSSENFDYTDNNGNLRRALWPKAASAAEERIHSTLDNEAPT